MIKTMDFASKEALERIKSRARTVSIAYREEKINDHLQPYVDEVVRVDGALNQNVRPALDFDEVTEVVRQEIQMAGSVSAVRVFCQEECNVGFFN